jgi:hypothetical protein
VRRHQSVLVQVDLTAFNRAIRRVQAAVRRLDRYTRIQRIRANPALDPQEDRQLLDHLSQGRPVLDVL